jgi:glucuronate isomerase
LNFIVEDFLLHSPTARRLYHDYAADQPILDYHTHLPTAEIAADRRFHDLYEIWLEGDHYKWRAMRANGVPECYCTGDAPAFDKYMAWARTIPFTLRNPLYHWTHLELKRYFGVDELLDESSAPSIWERANSALAELSAQQILRKFSVRALCTTDDPCDDLAAHHALNQSNLGFRAYPTFRPDPAIQTSSPDLFNRWVDRLESATNLDIRSLAAFLDGLKIRHAAFHQAGGRLSDHGLTHCHASPCTEAKAASIFATLRSGAVPSIEEQGQFASFMMLYFGHLDAERKWTLQLHLGAMRNVNTCALERLGPNTGFDTIGDGPQVHELCRYLDRLARENCLPKTIVYNVNPTQNYAFATAVGNFQGGSVPGKLQFGTAWWFLDQKEGIEWQINALSATGLLSRFVGMVTDSRSFMSFPRHEYFRRVLCDLLGKEMEAGDLPRDEKLIGSMVRNVCFANACNYLELELPPPPSKLDPSKSV